MKLFKSYIGIALPLKLRKYHNKTSFTVRQSFDRFRHAVNTNSEIASRLFRQMFEDSSTPRRQLFDNHSKDSRRPVEERWEITRRNVGPGTLQVISRYGARRNIHRSYVGGNYGQFLLAMGVCWKLVGVVPHGDACVKAERLGEYIPGQGREKNQIKKLNLIT